MKDNKELIEIIVGLITIFSIAFYFIGMTYFRKFLYLFNLDVSIFQLPSEQYYYRAFELIINAFRDLSDETPNGIVLYSNLLFVILTLFVISIIIAKNFLVKMSGHIIYYIISLLIFLFFLYSNSFMAESWAEKRFSLAHEGYSQFERVAIKFKGSSEVSELGGCFFLLFSTERSIFIFIDPVIALDEDDLKECLPPAALHAYNSIERVGCEPDAVDDLCSNQQKTFTLQIPLSNIEYMQIFPEGSKIKNIPNPLNSSVVLNPKEEE